MAINQELSTFIINRILDKAIKTKAMKNLEQLRSIASETKAMDFSYANVHRIMHLTYKTRELLESNEPIPNKEVALHQVLKLIENDIVLLIKSDGEDEIKQTFSNFITHFNLVLNYFL